MKKHGKALIRKLGFDIRRIQPDCELPIMEMPIIDVLALLIDNEIRAGERPFVVQIGANDGSASDPISESIQRHSLEALLVEPQPDAYAKLAASYVAAADRVKCVNALVSDTSGAVPFYTVKQTDGLPHWAYQSASLNRNVVSIALRMFRDVQGYRCIPANHESLIQTVLVPSLTWQGLLGTAGLTRVDILVIDAMGYDWELLSRFPFDTHLPRIIHFEHSLLSKEDERTCLQSLIQRGYSLIRVAVDTIAYRTTKTRSWEVLHP